MYVSVCYLERDINRQIGRNYARECSLMREIGDREGEKVKEEGEKGE